MGGAEVDIWGVSEVALFGKFAVESDFGGDGVAEHVGAEFGEVTFAIGDGGEILFKKLLAGGGAGGVPFVLVGKEEVFVFFPISLNGGSIGSRSSGSAIGVITLDVITINYGDFAVVFFDELVELRVDGGAVFALVVGIVKNQNRGVGVAVDVFRKIARFFAGREDVGEVVFGRGAISDAKADNTSKSSDDDCNNNPSFLIHEVIIAYLRGGVL